MDTWILENVVFVLLNSKHFLGNFWRFYEQIGLDKKSDVMRGSQAFGQEFGKLIPRHCSQ